MYFFEERFITNIRLSLKSEIPYLRQIDTWIDLSSKWNSFERLLKQLRYHSFYYFSSIDSTARREEYIELRRFVLSFFFFFRTRRIQTDPWSGKHWQSSHVHVDHSIHGREIGKVCELPRTPKVSLRIFFESLVIGAGRVHTELISCARMRHRSYARSIWSAPKRRQSMYSKRRRITPINYEAARGEGVGKKGGGGGRRKCKFRGEERRRGFHSRLRRTNTSLENYFAASRTSFVIVNRARRNEYEVIEGEGKFTELLNYYYYFLNSWSGVII